jgi:hypothetical protein
MWCCCLIVTLLASQLDRELLISIEEYHKTLCKKYDAINMLKHTTEENTQETKQIREYIKHLNLKGNELYGRDKINLITDSTHNTNNKYHCHNLMDNIAIQRYINTSKTRLNKLLQKYPKITFQIKQGKIMNALHNLTNDLTILI